MHRSTRETNAAGRSSDGMLVAIPIFALLILIVPVGPIGAPVGLVLAVTGLLIARTRSPSKHRANLIACSVMALIGAGVFTVIGVLDWLR